VVLHRGRLIASGTADDALTRPEPLGWGDAAGPVNLLRLQDVRLADGHLVAHLDGQPLCIPASKVPVATPLFVQFSPKDVILSRRDVTGLSARNRLQGRICRILDTRQTVFVAIDSG
jgi:ABC-type molybdate transport system ATPase subunit